MLVEDYTCYLEDYYVEFGLLSSVFINTAIIKVDRAEDSSDIIYYLKYRYT